MNKKVFSFFIILCLSLSTSFAQKERVMLFDDYSQGRVLFLNKAKIESSLNYDAFNHNMMFKQGTEEMILTNNNEIDTIYIGKRRFIPIGPIYLEVVTLKNGTVFINWNLRENVRQKGAYGSATQINIKYINTREFSQVENREQNEMDILNQFNLNEYWFENNGKYKKIKKMKDTFNLFSTNKEAISDFIRKNKFNYGNVEDMLSLINYCMGFKE